ncbi:MAG: hypothetical protein AB7P20_14415 [Rhizobiaceae bacterium]
MFRTSDTVLIAVMVAAAAFTYKTKHDAEDKYSEVRKLEAAIRYEEDSIDVLKADWSLLTQPARLQRLAETFAEQLKLQPVDPHQIVELKDLPDKEKELEVEDLIGGDLAPKQGKDKIVTGSVAQ